jgi:hypothetical protein
LRSGGSEKKLKWIFGLDCVAKKQERIRKQEMQSECPICYEECAKLSVTCCNGHTVCEKHYLQRCKAIYDEGRFAFGNGMAQCCPMCRAHVSDSAFSTVYFANQKLVIVQGMLKMAGKVADANSIMRVMKDAEVQMKKALE